MSALSWQPGEARRGESLSPQGEGGKQRNMGHSSLPSTLVSFVFLYSLYFFNTDGPGTPLC